MNWSSVGAFSKRTVQFSSSYFSTFLAFGLAAMIAPADAGAVDCTVPMAINGNATCTNSQTLTSSTPASPTLSVSGNFDLTNTNTGVISAGSNASAVYAGGGLTLNNSGRIVTLAGGSNATITATGSQTGTTTITNSGFMGDDAANGGGAQNVIRNVNAAGTFTLNNTASGIIKSTAGGFNAVVVQMQGAFNTVNNAGTIMATVGQSALTVVSSSSTSSTINNSGSLNAAGTRTFYGFVADTRGTVNFTNSGGIWGATNALWLTGGVTSTVNNTSSGTISAGSNVLLLENTRATIVNDGTITATGAPSIVRGVFNYRSAIGLASGSNLTLTNRGTISALGAGIKVESGALSANITNSGTIRATATGADARLKISGLYLDSTTGGTTVTNSGTISGAQYGVYLNSGSMTLTNSGTLSGGISAVYLGAGGTTVSNSGTISGGQYGVYLNSGAITLTNSGTISGGTSAVYLGAGGNTLNIYNGAVFTNGIDYNNTTGNTTNFYTGSYTLGVKKYGTGTNTIKLFGANTTLVTSGLDGTGTGNIVIVDNTPRVAATAASTSVTNYASAVVGDILLQDVGVVDVIPGDITADASPSVSVNAYQNDRKRSVKTSRASAAFAEVLGASAAAKATDLVLQGSGQTVDKYGNLVWTRAFGGAQFQDPYGTASGQRSYSGGAMFGYDWHGDGWRVGGFAGLGRMRTNQTLSPDYVTTDAFFGGAYGRYSFGNFNLDATVSGGGLNVHTRRFVNNGTEIARGDFNGYFVSPETALGYSFDLGDGLTVTPTGRLRYVGASLGSYTETGSLQNVSYAASFSNIMEERAEVRLTKKIKGDDGLLSSVYVQAGAITAQRIGPATFAASVLGTSFAVGDGYARSKAGASLGVGFTYKVTPQFDVYGSVDGSAFTDKSYSVSARGGFKVAF